MAKTAEKTQPSAAPAAVAAPAREEVRRPVQHAPGRAVVLNRAGQPVSRASAVSGVDQFYIPPNIIPPGWSWEWKNHTVLGQADPAYAAELAQVGWEPVMAESFDGVFMPIGHKGPIIRKGMILMERDIRLTQEARMEEKRRADDRVGNALRKHGKLDTSGTHGVDTSNRGIAPVANKSVISGNDLPRPGYERIPIE